MREVRVGWRLVAALAVCAFAGLPREAEAARREQFYVELVASLTIGTNQPFGVLLGTSYRWAPGEADTRGEYGPFGQVGWTQWRGFEAALGAVGGVSGLDNWSENYLTLWQAEVRAGPAMIVPVGWRAIDHRARFGVLAGVGGALSPRFPEASGLLVALRADVFLGSKDFPPYPRVGLGIELPLLSVSQNL